MRKTKLWLEKGLSDNVVAVVVAVAAEGLYLTFKEGGGGGAKGGGNYILKLFSGSSYGEIIFHPSFSTCERDPMMLKIQREPPRKNLWMALFKS